MKFEVNVIMRVILISIMLLLSSAVVPVDGQQKERNPSTGKPAGVAAKEEFTSGMSALRIPFELASNVIFLQVRVNGSEPFWFILDTGASATILDTSRAKSLGIKFKGDGRVEGAGESSTAAGSAKNVSFGLPGVDFQAREIGIITLSSLNRYTGRVVDGVLGHDFFNRYIVEIDYEACLINLYEPQTFQYSGSGDSVPIELKDNGSSVRARLAVQGRVPIEGNFRIDTGGSHALILHTPFVKAQNILKAVAKTVAAPAAGVGGETSVLLGRVRSLQLGRFALETPVTSFAQSTKGAFANPDLTGNIGGAVLRRFKVIFDYRGRRMILEPNSRFAQPFESDMSGMVLIAEGPKLDAFKIFFLMENSPASEAGLRVGDVINAIDDQPASTLTLDDVREMFKQSGREFLLSIKRGEQISQVKIKLRSLI